VKAARWILVAVLTVGVTGAAYACDHAKANTQQASAAGSCTGMKASSGNCAMSASTGTCSAHSMAQCSKMAADAAHHDCVFCNFVSEVKANASRVKVTTVDTDHGMTVVFAALSPNDVAVAQAVADKAYTMMSAPAHCSYTREKMASESCDGCKKSLGAFADAEVSMEKTQDGASATVTIKDQKEREQIHTFFASLIETGDKAGE
jgi:hypothetical protein